MKIGTVFVQKPLIRLLLSDCRLKVYILYPIFLFPSTNDRSYLVWALPCHFHTKCYYSTASLTLLLWSQPAHFALYWLQQRWSPENTILTLKRERKRERTLGSCFIFRSPCIFSENVMQVMAQPPPVLTSVLPPEGEFWVIPEKMWQQNT